MRHSFALGATYGIPGLSVAGGVGKALLRNWSLETIAVARTATTVNIFFRRDSGFGSFNLRPDVVSQTPLFYLRDSAAPGGRFINIAAFVMPQALRQGTLGRNALRAFPLSQLDFAVHRRIAFADNLNLHLKVEVFNAFNHPNFGDPVSDLGSQLFGLSTSTFGRDKGSFGNGAGFNPAYQIGGPRSLQLNFKLQF